MKQKDFETLVHAFSVVRNTRVVRLLILGEGADRPQLVELGQRLVSPMKETSSRFAHRDQERTNAQHVYPSLRRRLRTARFTWDEQDTPTVRCTISRCVRLCIEKNFWNEFEL